METKEANNGWFLAGDDPELKKDLQKKYEWFLRVLYRVLLIGICGYLLGNSVLYMCFYDGNIISIIKSIIYVLLIVVGLFGLVNIYTEFHKFKNAQFYVKTCKIVDFRGERAGKYTDWYVTVTDDNTVKEYPCKNNPWFSEEVIAAKKEITIATFDDVNEEEISLVYILDKVYTQYRI